MFVVGESVAPEACLQFAQFSKEQPTKWDREIKGWCITMAVD